MSIFTLVILCLTTSNLLWFMNLTFQFPRQYCSLQHRTLISTPDRLYFHHRHSHTWGLFLLWPSCFILSGVSSNCSLLFPSSILDSFQPEGVHVLVSYLFAFSYRSWCFLSKNTEEACHSLFEWTAFCQNSSLWPIHLGWPCKAWFMALLTYTSPFTMTVL